MKFFFKNFINLLCIIFIIYSITLFGWGAGHSLIAKVTIEKLPEEIKNILLDDTKKRIVEKWCFFPDEYTIEKIENMKDVISETSIIILKKYKINKSWDFHQENGIAVNFLLLTKALKEKSEKEIGFWIACLSHVISDWGAVNHGPLIHYITYGILTYGTVGLPPVKPEISKVNLGSGIGIDISEIEKIGGKELILKLLEDYKPQIIADEPKDAIMNMWIKRHEIYVYMLQKEKSIMKTYKIDKTEEDIEKGKQAMVEMGVIQIKNILDIVYTALNYAKKGIDIVFKEEWITEYKTKEKEFLNNRTLESESIYENLLKKEEKSSVIGIITSPTHFAGFGMPIPFGAVYRSAGIMAYLKEKQIPYEVIDYRDIKKSKISLLPSKIPLIIFEGKYCPEEILYPLKEYLNTGGTLLLIGGMTKFDMWKNLFGEYGNWFKEMSEDIRPVSPIWGDTNIEVVKKLSFYFLNDLKEYFGDKEYVILRNPNSTEGWQKPTCTIYIETEDIRFKKLIKISNGQKEVVIAGIINDERLKVIFIPAYFFHPFVFSEENILEDPSVPYLDKFGRKIIDFVINKFFKNENLRDG